MTNLVDDAGNSYVVDRSSTESSTPRVRKFNFGDGYEQRITDGINPLEQSFTVSFKNRTLTQANNLASFFETKGAVTSFAYSPPGFPTATGSSLAASYTVNGSGFGALDDDGWILISGSTSNDGGYSIDAAGTNTASVLTVYSSTVTSVTESFTVSKALGVTCEKWSIAYPQPSIASVSATFKRVYEP